MIEPLPHCSYYSMTVQELATWLNGAKPYLCPDWPTSNSAPSGALRAVCMTLLPWTTNGQEIDALVWPNGAVAVSERVWQALGGTYGV
jgi:hypothetical protein